MTSGIVLVTGANGQDGTYLIERLLSAGARVHAMCHSSEGAQRLRDAHPEVATSAVNLEDDYAVRSLIDEVVPERVFNLAGGTSVARSWSYPTATAEVIGVAPVRLLEALWTQSESTGVPVRFLQASSAEIFGNTAETPQTESTLKRPVTPYGAAKSFAHDMAAVYRARGMHVSTAILYNHESPRRPETFVGRKIATGVAKIALGLQETITLGNIDVFRDWGYAPDYVDAMIRILDQPVPDDFIVATGKSHSVRSFLEEAFTMAGVTDWERRVITDAGLFRPADPESLVGDPSRLLDIGWRPSVDFHELVRIMVQSELDRLSAEEATS